MKKVILFFSVTWIVFLSFTSNENQRVYSASSPKEFEQIIAKNIENINENIFITYNGNLYNSNNKYIYKDLEKIISENIKNHPDAIAKMSTRSYNAIHKNNAIYFSITIKYVVDSEKQILAEKKAKEVADEIKKNNKSDFSRLLALNEYIVKNTTYISDAPNAHSAYGVFYDKKAVCQGYSYAAYLILKELKIESKYIIGTAGEEDDIKPHSWNMVKLEGQWYHLDITFNDPPDRTKDYVSLKYFLVGDNDIKDNHYWDKDKYPISSFSYLPEVDIDN